jgi:hypothetical protein
MPLRPIPCPYDARLMVVALQVALCSEEGDDELGVSMMEALTPDQRLHLFRACEWLKCNPEWDRWTYDYQGG